MKIRFTIAATFLFIICAIGAYYAPLIFWQPLLINIATTFFAAAVGIILVNIYLDKESRKGAVVSLLQLSQSAIADFHDHVLDLAWTKFGKDEWGDLIVAYVKSEGDAMTIKPGFRQWIYELAKPDSQKLGPLIQKVDDSMQEIISLVGWSLDPDLLAFALRTRNSIRLYRGIPFDDSEEAKCKITEHLLDIDIQSHLVRTRLIELSEN